MGCTGGRERKSAVTKNRMPPGKSLRHGEEERLKSKRDKLGAETTAKSNLQSDSEGRKRILLEC